MSSKQINAQGSVNKSLVFHVYQEPTTQLSEFRKTSLPKFTADYTLYKNNVILAVWLDTLVTYLDLKSIINWGRTSKKLEFKILKNRSDYPHIENASFWVSTFVQRLIRRPFHQNERVKALERFVKIEEQFSVKISTSLFDCFSVSSTNISDFLNTISDLKILRKIELQGKKITDTHLITLNYLPKLEEITFKNCLKITEFGLSLLNCSKIVKLFFEDCEKVTDSDLVCLSKFTAIKELSFINCTCISGIALAHLKNHSRLHSITFKSCRVTDPALACLKNFPNLRELDLDSSILKTQLNHLKSLTRLHTLKITLHEPINDEGEMVYINIKSSDSGIIGTIQAEKS